MPQTVTENSIQSLQQRMIHALTVLIAELFVNDRQRRNTMKIVLGEIHPYHPIPKVARAEFFRIKRNDPRLFRLKHGRQIYAHGNAVYGTQPGAVFHIIFDDPAVLYGPFFVVRHVIKRQQGPRGQPVGDRLQISAN